MKTTHWRRDERRKTTTTITKIIIHNNKEEGAEEESSRSSSSNFGGRQKILTHSLSLNERRNRIALSDNGIQSKAQRDARKVKPKQTTASAHFALTRFRNSPHTLR